MTSPESILVLVVPRDRFSVFPSSLEALYAHTDLTFRVLVVAGGMDSSTEDYLHQFQAQKGNMTLARVDRLLKQDEVRKIAMQHADNRYCVVLENDTIVHEHWLSPLLECMQEEGATVVTPLIYWYRGLHAAGCMFDETDRDGLTLFQHRIMYSDIRRRRIDYPESHCVLIDREQLPDVEIFDAVEPFDVDFGLTLRKHGCSIFLEPSSVVTYAAPPPWEVRDIPLFKLRWNPALWKAGNQRFTQKWGVSYNPARKLASYRRQQRRLGPAYWYPNCFTVAAANTANLALNKVLSCFLRKHTTS